MRAPRNHLTADSKFWVFAPVGMLEYWINEFWFTGVLDSCSATGRFIKLKWILSIGEPVFHYSIVPWLTQKLRVLKDPIISFIS